MRVPKKKTGMQRIFKILSKRGEISAQMLHLSLLYTTSAANKQTNQPIVRVRTRGGKMEQLFVSFFMMHSYLPTDHRFASREGPFEVVHGRGECDFYHTRSGLHKGKGIFWTGICSAGKKGPKKGRWKSSGSKQFVPSVVDMDGRDCVLLLWERGAVIVDQVCGMIGGLIGYQFQIYDFVCVNELKSVTVFGRWKAINFKTLKVLRSSNFAIYLKLWNYFFIVHGKMK